MGSSRSLGRLAKIVGTLGGFPGFLGGFAKLVGTPGGFIGVNGGFARVLCGLIGAPDGLTKTSG